MAAEGAVPHAEGRWRLRDVDRHHRLRTQRFGQPPQDARAQEGGDAGDGSAAHGQPSAGAAVFFFRARRRAAAGRCADAAGFFA